MESQGKLKQQHDYNGQIAIVEQMLVSEERSKSQRAELWGSQSGIPVGKLTIWVSSFEIEKL